MGSGQLILRLSPEGQDISSLVGDSGGLKEQNALGQEEDTHRKQEVRKRKRKTRKKNRKHGTHIKQEMDRMQGVGNKQEKGR